MTGETKESTFSGSNPPDDRPSETTPIWHIEETHGNQHWVRDESSGKVIIVTEHNDKDS